MVTDWSQSEAQTVTIESTKPDSFPSHEKDAQGRRAQFERGYDPNEKK
jgi:hypothetical protein